MLAPKQPNTRVMVMVIVKHGKRPEMQATPPGPDHGHPRGFGPCMDGYINGLDRLSRIRRLDNIELSHHTNLRFNFRDYMGDYDDYYCMHRPPTGPRGMPSGPPPPPPPPPRQIAPGPPPPHSCGCPGCREPPPPPPGPPREACYYPPEPPYGPPPGGYPPCGFFNDQNPNGCSVM
ncbi:unnamed protein product [Ilex paraguariensis]|uniref:Uncharacterized protein n=1 Tax=Ilex paraguariensis TaxID=185542 RepID=A0ABC8RLF6_9AQUA